MCLTQFNFGNALNCFYFRSDTSNFSKETEEVGFWSHAVCSQATQLSWGCHSDINEFTSSLSGRGREQILDIYLPFFLIHDLLIQINPPFNLRDCNLINNLVGWKSDFSTKKTQRQIPRLDQEYHIAVDWLKQLSVPVLAFLNVS